MTARQSRIKSAERKNNLKNSNKERESPKSSEALMHVIIARLLAARLTGEKALTKSPSTPQGVKLGLVGSNGAKRPNGSDSAQLGPSRANRTVWS